MSLYKNGGQILLNLRDKSVETTASDLLVVGYEASLLGEIGVPASRSGRNTIKLAIQNGYNRPREATDSLVGGTEHDTDGTSCC